MLKEAKGMEHRDQPINGLAGYGGGSLNAGGLIGESLTCHGRGQAQRFKGESLFIGA